MSLFSCCRSKVGDLDEDNLSKISSRKSSVSSSSSKASTKSISFFEEALDGLQNFAEGLHDCIIDPDETNDDFCERADIEKYDEEIQALNWMSTIPDDKTILDLSIPGTHDAAALEGPAEGMIFNGNDTAGDIVFFGNRLTICQSLSINNQLSQGIRYFDIRLHYSAITSSLRMCHGPVLQSTYFGQDVASIFDKFLTENPSEIIIAKYKFQNLKGPAEGSSYEEFQKELAAANECLLSEIKQYASKTAANFDLYGGDITKINLGQIRGKILFFDNDKYLKNKTTFYGADVVRQNDYKIPDAETLEEKKKKVTNMLDLAVATKSKEGVPAKTLFMNALSGTGGVDSFRLWNEVRLFPEDIAKTMNSEVSEYFREKVDPLGRVGIITMDFPGARLISEIIKRNPKK